MGKYKFMIWLSGDSWLDWRSLIKSNLRFEDTLEGLLQETHPTLCFARGGSGNIRQLELIRQYSTFGVLSPQYWIHSWTEVGRDTRNRKYTTNCITDMSENIANSIVEIERDLKCKVLVFGGQAEIPQVAQEILKERVITPDWKADLLGSSDYGSSQYFSVITDGATHNLPRQKLKKHALLSHKQLATLTASERFPDNAHPGVNEYKDLYNKIKANIDARI
jgi:hypothetical protein